VFSFIEGNITTNFIPEEYPDGYKGHVLSPDDKHTLISAALLVKSRFVQARTTISNKLESYNPLSHHFNSIKENTACIGNELYLVKLINHDINPEYQSLTLTISRLEDKQTGKIPNLSKTLDAPASVTVSSDFKRGDVVFDVEINGNKHTLQLIEARDSSSVYQLQYLGTSFGIDLRPPRERELLSHMPEKQVLDTSKFVVSPMPGSVYSLSVKVGDLVHLGQEVCVIEAMKMQNALRAQRAGKIKVVNVSKGKNVSTDEILIEFE